MRENPEAISRGHCTTSLVKRTLRRAKEVLDGRSSGDRGGEG
jgi:hypothetical protein